MGMNYYLRLEGNPCACCGHDPEGGELHIGKSSAGWVFALHVIPEREVHDLEDWIPLFTQGVIRDETGMELSPGEMLERITERKGHSWRDLRQHGMSEVEFHAANNSMRGPNFLLRAQLGPHVIKHGAGTWDCHVGEFC